MKVVKFEPGDFTTYRVMFHRLTHDEVAEIGTLSDGAFLFGFCSGDGRPLHASFFQPRGYLAAEYYQERMREETEWTMKAGLVVLGHLSNREIDKRVLNEILAEWRAGWGSKLEKLL